MQLRKWQGVSVNRVDHLGGLAAGGGPGNGGGGAEGAVGKCEVCHRLAVQEHNRLCTHLTSAIVCSEWI